MKHYQCPKCNKKAYKVVIATIPVTTQYQCENIDCEMYCKKIIPNIWGKV